MISFMRRVSILIVALLLVPFAGKTFGADPVDQQRAAIDEAVARVKPSLVRIQVVATQ